MFPIEKYKYHFNGNTTIAISTYAGKTVRGVSKCAPTDNYDRQKGKELAAARCARKIAKKRLARAEREYLTSKVWEYQVAQYVTDSTRYYFDAMDEYEEAIRKEQQLTSEM